MSTSSLTYSSGLLGQAEAATAATASASKSSSTLGKDDFLKLLVTQLQQQNPLNPMDDKDFVAQMAQFSSLEQLTNISSGISTMTSAINQQGLVSAVSFIGKSVEASGTSIVKSGETISPVSYTLSDDASTLQINIFDSSGNIVRTDSLGSKNAGDYTYQWDGKDYNGKTVDDGTYTIAMGALNSSGSSILVDPVVSGTVTGVQSSNGAYVLNLSDGRSVNLTDIKKVNNTTDTTS